MRVAYLACAETLPGSEHRRPDAFEHDQMMSALAPAFSARGAAVEDLRWDAPGVRWAHFDAVIVGTTWDYADRQQAFLDACVQIESQTLLLNPVALLRWNAHKRYLQQLAARGVAVVPTVWLDTPSPGAIASAMAELRTDDAVVKHQVGAGAYGQVRVTARDAMPQVDRPVMVQPFLPTIQSDGEQSLIYVDGALCHGLLKLPAQGDYRTQSMYGGTEQAIHPGDSQRTVAAKVLEACPVLPLYARVDLVEGPDGPCLMELELVEPFLYPLQGPELGPRLAEAVVGRIAHSQPAHAGETRP